MKTKTSILAALVAIAGSFSLMAQSNVYSVNVVGYVNVDLPVGYSLIANPLNGVSNHLDNILTGMADGTIIYRYGSTFSDAIQYYSSPEFTGWFSANPSETYTLNPGEGFFIQNNSNVVQKATFVGEVPQGALTNAIPSGYSIRASQVPQALPVGNASSTNTLMFPAVDGDIVYVFNNATQTYKDAFQYYASEEFTGWFTATADPGPAGPTIPVGGSFFVLKAAPANWTRSFTVN